MLVIRAPGVQISELLLAVGFQASQTLRDSVFSFEKKKNLKMIYVHQYLHEFE